MIFKGSGVALVTPFDKNNNVDYKKLKDLIKFHIKKNTDAIIVCGTTGESATLSDDEKKKIIKVSVDTSKGKIPIIAGTGSNDTSHAIQMSQYAKNARCRWIAYSYTIL